MIVDLLRNDLGRVAEIGSVGVDELYKVETYPTLHTMVSTVTAKLMPGADAATIVRALFPCGSITGAPKIHAMEIIRALEQGPRGVYCGAIGHFAPDGSARFNVAIRTLTIEGGRGELGIGGAVVQDSRSGAEYAECLLKARYYESARRPIELIETLGFDPRKGLVRCERHLDRMARSAAEFGIAFDRDAALDTLDMATRDSTSAWRVRLTLDESGAFGASRAPHPGRAAAWTYTVSPLRIDSGDFLLRHKTNWREFYDNEHARLAHETGCDEVIFLNERGEVAEASRCNVFARIKDRLVTPPLEAGVLPGCLRAELLETGQCFEARLSPEDLLRADEVFLGNSLRGLIRAVPAASARATA